MVSLSFQKQGNRYSWVVIGMLWLICFLNYADRQAITAVFPLLTKQFGFSKFQLGLIGSVFMWVYALLVFYAGFLSDRVSRKALILGGCFFWSLITIATSWCTVFWQFVAIRALEGMGEACYFPSSNSLIADYHPEERRSMALAFHQSGVYIGTIAGSALGAWLGEHYGWQYGFYFFGGLGVFLSLFLFLFLKEPRLQKHSKHVPSLSFWKTLHYLSKCPVLIFIILAFICANFVAAIFLTWMPTFLYEKFHMTLALAGFLAVAFIQLSSAVSGPCSGWLADQLAKKMLHGRIVLQSISLFVGVIAIILIGKLTSIPLLLLAMACFGICKGGYDSGIFGALYDYVPLEMRGAAAGLVITCGWFGGALGPVFIGAVSTYGIGGSAIQRMGSAISASAGAYALGALLLLMILFISRKKSTS